MSAPEAAGAGGLRPWVVLVLLGGLVAVIGGLWVVAEVAAGLGGGHVAAPVPMARHLIHGQPDLAWPGVGTGWLVGAGVLLTAAAVTVGIGLARLRHRFAQRGRGHRTWQQALPSLASRGEMAPLGPAEIAARARRLRPSLATTPGRPAPAQTGWLLGSLLPNGPDLRASWEDVAVAIMAPRAGKTAALAVPTILAAPGPVVATSNKNELVTMTGELMTEAGRRVWVFDPQSIAYMDQIWWWDPLAAVGSIETADRLAAHFVQEIRGTDQDRGDFWSLAAGDLLSSLLLAAAADGRTLVDVYRWLNDSSTPLPAELLDRHGHAAVAAGLRGRQAGAVETREGVYETARAAAQCLRSPQILRWVTPGQADHRFNVTAFATTTDVLHLLSKDDAGSAAPLVAALTDQVLHAAVRHAEARGGRLDPPLMLVLDEAANICKIRDLPALYSHLGSRGVIPLTILQSVKQGAGVWGDRGMAALWGAATIKILGSGLDDAEFTEQISRLVGEHDIDTQSYSGSEHGTSWSVQPRRQRILDAADIRAIPKGWALLLATGLRPAALRLHPWYTSPDRQRIARAQAAADQALSDRAAAVTPAEGQAATVGAIEAGRRP